MHRPSQLALVLASLCFGVVGVAGWLSPDTLFAPVGAEFRDAAAYAEIRAAYGGHFVGAALFFGYGAWNATWTRPALIYATLVLGGFVLGRLISLGVEGVPSAVALFTLGIEAAGFLTGAALLAWRSKHHAFEA